MAWIMLILAGLFEVGWAIGLKYTEGFTRPWPTAGTVAAMIASLWLLGIAMKSLPVGTAYAVWVGVGAVGTVILGIVLPLAGRPPIMLQPCGTWARGYKPRARACCGCSGPVHEKCRRDGRARAT